MNPFIKRFLGTNLILFAIIGILISMSGIFGVWRLHEFTTDKLSETTAVVDDALKATYEGLIAGDQMLVEVTETIGSSENVLSSMSQTMGDINGILDGFLDMFRMFMPVQNQRGNTLENTTENIEVFETEMANIAVNLRQVKDKMIETQSVMGDYIQAIADTQILLEDFQANGPRWITILTWSLTILFVWFAITQAVFILQGLELIQKAKEQQEKTN